VAEEAPPARNSEGHAAELAKDAVPFFEGDPVESFKVGKNLEETGMLVCWEGKDLEDGIHNPTKPDLPGCVASIALGEFFEGGHVVADRGIVGVQRSKIFVERMEQGTPVMRPFSSAPLDDAEQVPSAVPGQAWPQAGGAVDGRVECV
jgi:hypothetical protein